MIKAVTPFDWRPRTSAAEILPDSRGSSEKYSKLRPPHGLRRTLAATPYQPLSSSAIASSPTMMPRFFARSAFQVEAMFTGEAHWMPTSFGDPEPVSSRMTATGPYACSV